MVKKIRCKIDDSDWVRARISTVGTGVVVTVTDNEKHSVILTPTDAHKLRKQIKKAIITIEGDGESEA